MQVTETLQMYRYQEQCSSRLERDRSVEGGYGWPSSLLVTITYRQSHLHTRFGLRLSRSSAGTGSLGFTSKQFAAHNLKFFTAQRVLASVLHVITPHAAFSLSGEVVKRRIEPELQRITPFGFHQTGADNKIALQKWLSLHKIHS